FATTALWFWGLFRRRLRRSFRRRFCRCFCGGIRWFWRGYRLRRCVRFGRLATAAALWLFLSLGGGVAANSRLRARAMERAGTLDLRIPPARLCTDNGAMVAALGSALVARGRPASAPGLGADSSLPVDSIQMP
ncbi:MAG: hypothetical protein VW362_10030, partial [Candidatus Nanopelagicales bacterium]